MPPELVRYITSFVSPKCYCCLREFQNIQDIPITRVFQMHHHKTILYFCDEDCEMFM